MAENFAVSTDRVNQQQILLHRQVILFLTVYFLPLQSKACSIQIKNLAVDTYPNEPTARHTYENVCRECVVTCIPGHAFPDGSARHELTCVGGDWRGEAGHQQGFNLTCLREYFIYFQSSFS
jgi:hypothetical protein